MTGEPREFDTESIHAGSPPDPLYGAVSVGADLPEACDRMELGELSAKTVLLAVGDRGPRLANQL